MAGIGEASSILALADVKQRLASYKSTLSIAFDLINIADHSTSQESLDQLKDDIQGTKEDIEDQLDKVRQAITTATVTLSNTLQADQARLQRSLDGLVHAQSIADNTRPQVVIEKNIGGQGSRTLFGTDTSQPQFDLTASGNEAQTGAVMAAGVHSPQTLQALLGESRTADLALVLQALQTQSPSTIATTLQTHLNNIPAAARQGPTTRSAITDDPTRLRISAQEETADLSEMPAQSASALHKNDSNFDGASG